MRSKFNIVVRNIEGKAYMLVDDHMKVQDFLQFRQHDENGTPIEKFSIRFNYPDDITPLIEPCFDGVEAAKNDE